MDEYIDVPSTSNNINCEIKHSKPINEMASEKTVVAVCVILYVRKQNKNDRHRVH